MAAGQPETGEDGAGPDGAPVSSHAGTLGPAAWNGQHLPPGGDLLLAETQRETMEDKTKTHGLKVMAKRGGEETHRSKVHHHFMHISREHERRAHSAVSERDPQVLLVRLRLRLYVPPQLRQHS